MIKVDFLIVGQGLAGSVLAHTMCQSGQSVYIIADHRPSASAVAAGIYNPITGRKLSKTWQADVLFPFLKTFYTSLEGTLQANFLHECTVYRPFRDVAETNQYIARSADYPEYLQVANANANYASLVHNDLGGIETLQAGWVNLPILLGAFRKYFEGKQCFREAAFVYNDLQISPQAVHYQGIEAKYIVFAEGYYGHQNPWFGWLPFTHTKGEVLTIQSQTPVPPNIINQGIFLLPTATDTWKLGATNWRGHHEWQPTEKGKAELLEKANKLLKLSFNIQEHKAGIRPTTADRRPFVGLHPKHANVGIFNGLGTKGVSLAPYFAKQFTDFLLHNKELHPEVNITRFFALYP